MSSLHISARGEIQSDRDGFQIFLFFSLGGRGEKRREAMGRSRRGRSALLALSLPTATSSWPTPSRRWSGRFTSAKGGRKQRGGRPRGRVSAFISVHVRLRFFSGSRTDSRFTNHPLLGHQQVSQTTKCNRDLQPAGSVALVALQFQSSPPPGHRYAKRLLNVASRSPSHLPAHE